MKFGNHCCIELNELMSVALLIISASGSEFLLANTAVYFV